MADDSLNQEYLDFIDGVKKSGRAMICYYYSEKRYIQNGRKK
jgi:hypothetical protein